MLLCVDLCRAPTLICFELLRGEEDSWMEFNKVDWENGDFVGRLKKGVGVAQLKKEKKILDNDVDFFI